MMTRDGNMRRFMQFAAVAVVVAAAAAGRGDAYPPADLPRPQGFGVWNADPLQQVADGRFDFSAPPVRPAAIKLVAPRNGSASGQVVVADAKPLDDVRAVASDLQRGGGGGGAIVAAAVRVRYAAMRPDAEFATVNKRPHEFNYCAELLPSPEKGNIVPVWVTVTVPADGAAGLYAGSLAVSAVGRTVEVPVELKVCDWALPDTNAWASHVDVVQSPDSVARRYGVPLYSPAHFAKLDRSLALIGQLGNKACWVPLVAGGMPGVGEASFPTESMVRYARDGQDWRFDFTRMDRYLDLYQKHCGTPASINFYVWTSQGGVDVHPRRQADTEKVKPFAVTGADGKPIELRHFTPEADALFAQLFAALRERVVRRGWPEGCVMLGLAMDARPSARFVEQMKAAAPYARWVLHAHDPATEIHGQPVGYCADFRGSAGFEGPGWRNPRLMVKYPYDNPRTFAPLPYWRYVVELAATRGYRGFGRIGGDCWSLPPADGAPDRAAGRDEHWVGGQPTMRLSNYLPALLAAGPEGAEPTVLFETLREGQQELEARIFVEQALAGGKLPAPLAERCRATLQSRKFPIRRIDEPVLDDMIPFIRSDWQDRLPATLFDLAGDVAKAAAGDAR